MGVLSSETSVLCVWEIFQLFKRIRVDSRLVKYELRTKARAYDTESLRMVHLVPVQYQISRNTRSMCEAGSCLVY